MTTTDLLIIGAGPAGLMAACWASQYNMITRIIDQKPGRTRTGHADGLHSRTLEITDSFGLVDHILRQAVVESEMCYWAWCVHYQAIHSWPMMSVGTKFTKA